MNKDSGEEFRESITASRMTLSSPCGFSPEIACIAKFIVSIDQPNSIN
jgi:hypothetical protein